MGRNLGDTTRPLDESVRETGGSGGLGIRWLTPGAPDPWLPIGHTKLTIGRGPGVAIVLDAAGLSRSHVEIYRQGPACIAHDLSSTNGTFVNGRRTEYAPLADGDVLRLGDVVGVVSRASTDPADATRAVPELDLVSPTLAFGPGLQAQLAQVRRIAPTDLPVVITGETGVGKEHVAHALHLLSGRRGPFHAVNCAALPGALAEAELFGHARGAFTGAEQASAGHLRAADGGTLFLDELPELPPAVQAKLLRVLQDGQVTPLGETRARPVDLRVVAACQPPLDQLVARGTVRADLAARLAGAVVTVPPLRSRRADVGLFFGHLLAHHARKPPPAIDPRTLECALLHDWPGNMRELDLLVRRLLAMHGDEPVLRRSFLPAAMTERLHAADEPAPGGEPAPPPSADRDGHDLRRLAAELRGNGGNVTRAASAAGLSRARAYRLMRGRSAEQLLAELEPDATGATPAAGPANVRTRR